MTPVEIFTIIASMLAGLALFLAGMHTLSESLTLLTGGALNRLIGKITKNKYFGFLFGTVLTAIVQSSSAITVLAVGLVNSGIVELSGVAGLIIGANLGTTATAWLLSLNAISGESLLMTVIKPSSFSPFLAVIGVFMIMFCRSDKKKNIGSVLLGFSMMMIGMNLMSSAVAPLKEIPLVQDVLTGMSNPVMGFLAACLFAMMIQSSDAVVGIIQAFALSMGITYGMAIPMVCGAQVGTCITSMISSLGTSNNGKRTALLNLYYNLLKTVPFLAVFYALNSAFRFGILSQTVGGVGIPLFHTLVNLLGSLVWLPLSGALVSLARRSVRLSETEKEIQANTLTMLDENLLVTPSFALDQADTAVVLLSETVGEAFTGVVGLRDKPESAGEIRSLCGRAKQYQRQIDAYLMKIREKELSGNERAKATLLNSACSVFGKMGLLTERILEKAGTLEVTPEMRERLQSVSVRVLGESICEILQLTVTGFSAKNAAISRTIRYYREEIDEISAMLKKRYIHYIQENGRDDLRSLMYTDISYAQEQLIDYCDMIAEALIRYEEECGGSRKKAAALPEQTREQIHEMFRDKLELLQEE